MRLWWYNNVKRHFWYHYFNWRYPHLPRVRPGRISRADYNEFLRVFGGR
jgi:hypothetical protein